MPKRTYYMGKLVSTFPCGKGYVTSVYGKYGETLHSEYSFSYTEALLKHKRLVSAKNSGKIKK